MNRRNPIFILLLSALFTLVTISLSIAVPSHPNKLTKCAGFKSSTLEPTHDSQGNVNGEKCCYKKNEVKGKTTCITCTWSKVRGVPHKCEKTETKILMDLQGFGSQNLPTTNLESAPSRPSIRDRFKGVMSGKGHLPAKITPQAPAKPAPALDMGHSGAVREMPEGVAWYGRGLIQVMPGYKIRWKSGNKIQIKKGKKKTGYVQCQCAAGKKGCRLHLDKANNVLSCKANKKARCDKNRCVLGWKSFKHLSH